jgi:N-acetylglutamate synthase-like GNAT family acetyltransferase
MIRHSIPEDTPEIARLALAQYQRTPWPLDGCFPVAEVFHVCERGGQIAACAGYRRDGETVRVMHVWAQDGFSGRRAAVELMEDLEAMADAEECDLVFDTMPENVGLQAAVAKHGCTSLDGDHRAIAYRRKARQWGVPA